MVFSILSFYTKVLGSIKTVEMSQVKNLFSVFKLRMFAKVAFVVTVFRKKSARVPISDIFSGNLKPDLWRGSDPSWPTTWWGACTRTRTRRCSCKTNVDWSDPDWSKVIWNRKEKSWKVRNKVEGTFLWDERKEPSAN